MSDKHAILDLAPIAAAIREAMPDLIDVGTASSLAALTPETVRSPSAYVVPLAETPSPNTYVTDAVLKQRVVARFAVIWCVRDIGDRMGSIANGAITSVRSAGMIAVCKIRPEDAEGACEPVSGKLVSGIDRAGNMRWQDDFAVPLNRHIHLNT